VLAVAVFGALMAAVFAPHLRGALSAAGVPADLAAQVWQQRDRLAAIELPPGSAEGAVLAVRGAVQDAFVAGYRWIMGVSAALALASAAVAALWVDKGGSAAAGARPR
jgi:hypothetical protein